MAILAVGDVTRNLIVKDGGPDVAAAFEEATVFHA